MKSLVCSALVVIITSSALGKSICDDAFEGINAQKFVEDVSHIVVRPVQNEQDRADKQKSIDELSQTLTSKISNFMKGADKAIVDLSYFTEMRLVDKKWIHQYQWKNVFKKGADAYNLDTFQHPDVFKFIPHSESTLVTFPRFDLDRPDYIFDIATLECTVGH
jgi:hypothetical protein